MADPIATRDVFIAGKSPQRTYNQRKARRLEGELEDHLLDSGEVSVPSCYPVVSRDTRGHVTPPFGGALAEQG